MAAETTRAGPKTDGRTLRASRTRLRILDVARELFNEQGTGAVSTHQVADATGLSPGNLYYHFRNKDEIIREIVRRMDLLDAAVWRARGPAGSQTTFLSFMTFFFDGLDAHRFFFREFSLLILQDPDLATLWRARYGALFDTMREACRLWIETGIMNPFDDDAALDAFIDNCWTIASFSSFHHEAKTGSPDDVGVKHRASLSRLASFLHPYHTSRGRRELARFFATR